LVFQIRLESYQHHSTAHAGPGHLAVM